MRHAALVCTLCLLVTPAWAGRVLTEPPSNANPAEKFVFYLHGQAIETGGARAREYRYADILNEIAARGFTVIGEARTPVSIEDYAEKVSRQVNALLAAGVPPRHITVAGHSKGGMIALHVMTLVARAEIAYLAFASCGKAGSGFDAARQLAEHGARAARGIVFSVYDRSDRIAGTCRALFEKMPDAVASERELDVGGGHELFFQPKPEWLEQLQLWAERRS